MILGIVRRVRRGYWFFGVALLVIIGMGCQRNQRDRTASIGNVSDTNVPTFLPSSTQSRSNQHDGSATEKQRLPQEVEKAQSRSNQHDGSAAEKQRLPQEVEKAQDVGISEGFRRNEDLDQVVLASGDAIEVKFYYTPELDVNQVIRPDGYISMLLVGEVKAAGKNPADLGAELTTRYGWHLKNPQIIVIVRSLYNRRVYVGGSVDRPGILLMPGPMTLSEAIVEVGGFEEKTARAENVIVVRNKGGQRQIFKVDMRKAMKDIDAEPFNLLPKDIVYVPQTRIARADQWVDQYLNMLVPKFVYMAWYPFGYPYR